MRSIKPIFLFADSQILFWRHAKGLFVERIKEIILEDENRPRGEIKTAYIGASNGDKVEYFDIFVAAMNQVGITQNRHILAKPTTEDYTYLRTTDLILLAGGSVIKGWNAFKKSELQQKIVECYHNGAVLIGVSAGAVQLGLCGWKNKRNVPTDYFETFQVVPAVIDVHDEADWEDLRKIVKHLGKTNRGYGIPAGGGAVYHPDWSFEAIRHHLTEFSYLDEEVKRSLIFPHQEGMPIVETDPNDRRGTILKPEEVLTSGIINIDADIIEH